MSESIEKINRNFIQARVNPILEKMLIDILVHKPEKMVPFMKQWLDENGEKYSTDHHIPKKVSVHTNAYGESSSEESDVEEVIEELPKQAIVQGKAGRTSVSAEAYGKYNLKANFKPKFIAKTPSQIDRIKTRLNQAFMFSGLEEKELEIVINAMTETKFSSGATVIRQGDDGDNLYIIDSGHLDCHKLFGGGDKPKYLKTYEPGESFGELALLYNAPRAATITARENCILFALDRETFNHIVKDAAAKKREKYETFLSKVELLESMDPYERSKIADALKPYRFKMNEYVVKEGESGDTFFFVEEGEAIATKVLQPGKAPEIVYKYKAGDYFGELALLRESPRAANIVAVTELSVVALDRLSFKRLIGPLEDILKRNFARYEKFLT